MSEEIKENIAFAEAVSNGDNNASRAFVDKYTDLVLNKVWSLSKSHCVYKAQERICSLMVLQKQRRGVDYYVEDQCDDCMGSYIWFFDYLKNRVKSYKGKNNCTLKTYIWSVVNADTTYKDWLRWKYGRAY